MVSQEALADSQALEGPRKIPIKEARDTLIFFVKTLISLEIKTVETDKCLAVSIKKCPVSLLGLRLEGRSSLACIKP